MNKKLLSLILSGTAGLGLFIAEPYIKDAYLTSKEQPWETIARHEYEKYLDNNKGIQSRLTRNEEDETFYERKNENWKRAFYERERLKENNEVLFIEDWAEPYSVVLPKGSRVKFNRESWAEYVYDSNNRIIGEIKYDNPVRDMARTASNPVVSEWAMTQESARYSRLKFFPRE